MPTVLGSLALGVAIAAGRATASSQTSPGPGSQTPSLGEWIDPLDSRADDASRYESRLQAQVAHLVTLATVDTPGNVIDAEKELWIEALPLLHQATQRPDLPPAATKALADAWRADADRVRRSESRRKALDWHHKTSLDVFDANIPAYAHWAAPARIALAAAVGIWSSEGEPTGDGDMILWREGYYAVQAHCTDPLVLYARAQNLALFTPRDVAGVLGASRRVERSIENSKYPPIRKLYAALRLAQRLAESKSSAPKDAAEIERLVALGKTLFPQVLADPDLPRRELIHLFDVIGDASIAIHKDRRTLPAQLFDMLEGAKIDRGTMLTVQGYFNVDYAWDARGGGWANTVTADGARLMAQRLKKAQGALEEAWRLNPSNSDAAACMIRVELGQGEGRDRMEKWFDRAVAADPDNYGAYQAELYYLQPKWYGSIEDMVAFGRQCLAKANWDGSIPMVVIDAHMDAAHYTANGWQPSADPAYFQGNEAAWQDIKAAYAGYSLHTPRNDYQKLQYAKLAGWCGHWDEAHRTFLQLGKAFDPRIFSSELEQNKFAAEAADRAAAGPTSNP